MSLSSKITERIYMLKTKQNQGVFGLQENPLREGKNTYNKCILNNLLS